MSKQEEIEQKIREQRTVEANKKGLVGQNGKIGVVLRMMGGPIVSQSEGGTYLDTNYIYQEEENEEEPRNALDMMTRIPTMDLDGSTRPDTSEWSEMKDAIPYSTQNIGWHFDGLSRGMHIEIKYDDERSELTVHHKGYLVYKEIRGELVAYVPKEEWENWIEALYKKAKDIQRKVKEEEFENQVKEADKIKEGWWQELKKRWGVE